MYHDISPPPITVYLDSQSEDIFLIVEFRMMLSKYQIIYI